MKRIGFAISQVDPNIASICVNVKMGQVFAVSFNLKSSVLNQLLSHLDKSVCFVEGTRCGLRAQLGKLEREGSDLRSLCGARSQVRQQSLELTALAVRPRGMSRR